MTPIIKHLAPTAADYIALRATVDWGTLDLQQAQVSLTNSLYHVSAWDGPDLVGMGRVIGDGALFFYIQDLVVLPEYQGLGLGHRLMLEIEEYLSRTVTPGATIGLFAARGKEAFYSRYGYLTRSGDPLGAGMCKFVS